MNTDERRRAGAQRVGLRDMTRRSNAGLRAAGQMKRAGTRGLPKYRFAGGLEKKIERDEGRKG